MLQISQPCTPLHLCYYVPVAFSPFSDNPAKNSLWAFVAFIIVIYPVAQFFRILNIPPLIVAFFTLALAVPAVLYGFGQAIGAIRQGNYLGWLGIALHLLAVAFFVFIAGWFLSGAV